MSIPGLASRGSRLPGRHRQRWRNGDRLRWRRLGPGCAARPGWCGPPVQQAIRSFRKTQAVRSRLRAGPAGPGAHARAAMAAGAPRWHAGHFTSIETWIGSPSSVSPFHQPSCSWDSSPWSGRGRIGPCWMPRGAARRARVRSRSRRSPPSSGSRRVGAPAPSHGSLVLRADRGVSSSSSRPARPGPHGSQPGLVRLERTRGAGPPESRYPLRRRCRRAGRPS